jgi:uncharacterized protein YjiS (DUF1127 family)
MQAHPTYPLTAPARQREDGRPRPIDRLGRRLAAIIRRVQYGQMIRALDQLPGHVLAELGLRRRDIPDHAHRLIYGRD